MLTQLIDSWSEALPETINVNEVKSALLTFTVFTTVLPSSYENKSKLFYKILDFCQSGKLQGNSLLFKPNQSKGEDFNEILGLLRTELEQLRRDLLENCLEDYFWGPIEAIFSKSTSEIKTKKVAPVPPIERYLNSLKPRDLQNIYEKDVRRLNSQAERQDMVKTARITLKLVALNEKQSRASLAAQTAMSCDSTMKDLCDNLLNKEKDGFYRLVEDLKIEFPSAMNLFNLCNNMNPYRETFVFDILKACIEQQRRIDQINAHSVGQLGGAGKNLSGSYKIYYKYFRKAIEYGVGQQMFLMQNCLEPSDIKCELPAKRRRTEEQSNKSVSATPTSSSRSTNVSKFWLQIDQIRKLIGSLQAVNWQSESSTPGDLLALYKNMVNLANKHSGASKNKVALAKSTPWRAQPDAVLGKNSVEQKQLFYTCLQVLIQAAGAYCELVEPFLVYGSLEAYRAANSEASETDQNENRGRSSSPNDFDNAMNEEEKIFSNLSIFPVKNETRAMLCKLNLLEDDVNDDVHASSSSHTHTISHPRSRHSSAASAAKRQSPPKKYNCTVDQLLFVFQQTESILENEQLTGDDWEKQMKKKWHVDKMPYYVLTRSSLDFLDGKYAKSIEDLENLSETLKQRRYFGFPLVQESLDRRLAFLKLLSGIELKEYQKVEEATKVFTEGPSQPDGEHYRLSSTSQVYSYSSGYYGEFSNMVNFTVGRDFINRAKFYSILYSNRGSNSGSSVFDNESLFLIVASQLFLAPHSDDAGSDHEDLGSTRPDPLKSKVDTLLKNIASSTVIEEAVLELQESLEKSGQTAPENLQTRNFDFVRLLDNVISLELLEKIHDARLQWKESYTAKKVEFLTKKQKDEAVKSTQKTSKKSKRRQPQVAAALSMTFGKLDTKSTNPKDEDAYNNALEVALLRCEEGETPENVAKVEAFLVKLASCQES